MSVPALPHDAPSLDALRSAVDAMDDLVVLLDPTGRTLHVNRVWQDRAAAGDIDPADLAGLWAGAGAGGRAPAAIAAGVRDVLEGRRDAFEAEHRLGPPGAGRWLALRATPIAVDGVGALVVHTDVSARRTAEHATAHADRRGAPGLAHRRFLERRLGELLAEGPVGVLALRLHATALRGTAELVRRLVGDDAVAGRLRADLVVVLLPGAGEARLGRTATVLQAGWLARVGRTAGLDATVATVVGRPGERAAAVLGRAAEAADHPTAISPPRAPARESPTSAPRSAGGGAPRRPAAPRRAAPA